MSDAKVTVRDMEMAEAALDRSAHRRRALTDGERAAIAEECALQVSRARAAGYAQAREDAVAELSNRCIRQVGESALIPGYNRCMDDVERSIAAIRAMRGTHEGDK
jgi:hypothetical protein